MSAGEGRLAVGAAPPSAAAAAARLPGLVTAIPTGADRMLYYSMRHRTQLYLDEGQYRWLRQRAGKSGSIAAAVREQIDAERARLADPAADPLLRFLVDESPARGPEGTSVSTLDRDLYGA
jgi:hypothetical protein